eukprot:Opistho-1_new@102760
MRPGDGGGPLSISKVLRELRKQIDRAHIKATFGYARRGATSVVTEHGPRAVPCTVYMVGRAPEEWSEEVPPSEIARWNEGIDLDAQKRRMLGGGPGRIVRCKHFE